MPPVSGPRSENIRIGGRSVCFWSQLSSLDGVSQRCLPWVTRNPLAGCHLFLHTHTLPTALSQAPEALEAFVRVSTGTRLVNMSQIGLASNA